MERESPFLFAVLVAVGARFLHRTESYNVAFANARRQADSLKSAQEKGTDGMDERLSDLKALTLLAAYGGLPELVDKAMVIAVDLQLPLVFSRLADGTQKSDAEERALVERGRAFLMVSFLDMCYCSSAQWIAFAKSRFPAPVELASRSDEDLVTSLTSFASSPGNPSMLPHPLPKPTIKRECHHSRTVLRSPFDILEVSHDVLPSFKRIQLARLPSNDNFVKNCTS